MPDIEFHKCLNKTSVETSLSILTIHLRTSVTRLYWALISRAELHLETAVFLSLSSKTIGIGQRGSCQLALPLHYCRQIMNSADDSSLSPTLHQTVHSCVGGMSCYGDLNRRCYNIVSLSYMSDLLAFSAPYQHTCEAWKLWYRLQLAKVYTILSYYIIIYYTILYYIIL